MSGRRVKVLGVLSALLVALAACGGGDNEASGSDAESEPQRLVAIAGSSKDFIAIVPLAAWKILEEEEGIVVEHRFVEEASTAIQSIVQGDAQIGTNIGVNVGVPAVEQGAQIVDVVATQRPTWALAARPDVESIEDLDGKKVAVHDEASFTRAVSQFFAREYGFEYEELIIPGSEVRAEALARGKIDGSVIDLPDVVQLEHTYPGEFHVLRTIGEELPDLIEQDIWLDSEWASENEDTAVKIVRSIVEAARRLTEDREFALELATEEYPEIEESVLEELITEYSERGLWPADGLLTPERALGTLEFFDEVGEIELEGPITEDDLGKYFNFDYLNQALASLEGA